MLSLLHITSALYGSSCLGTISTIFILANGPCVNPGPTHKVSSVIMPPLPVTEHLCHSCGLFSCSEPLPHTGCHLDWNVLPPLPVPTCLVPTYPLSQAVRRGSLLMGPLAGFLLPQAILNAWAPASLLVRDTQETHSKLCAPREEGLAWSCLPHSLASLMAAWPIVGGQ